MGWMRRLFRRDRLEWELAKELAYHMDRRIADLIAGGIDAREAARRVRLEFGAADEVKEACRDARGTRWVHDFLQDCRYGLRLLRRSPVFASVAILSLALGIGANTAIFSLMDRIMLRMMPVPEPDRLVELVRFWGDRRSNHAYPHFQQLREALQSFEALTAHSWLGEHEIVIDGENEIARIEMASGAYHSMLGVKARAGRTFTEDVDPVPGANPVAVISEAYWERRFGSDPSAVGKTFRRRGTVFTIIGVTPREFTGVALGKIADITFPVSMAAEVRGGRESWLQDSGTHWLNVMGRLKAETSISQARSEVAAVFARIAAADAKASPDERHKTALLSQRMELQPAADGFNELRRDFAKPLAILMGTVTLVLLLACVNLANLLLARSAVRQREVAVRLALGAGRWRVVRQMLAEALPLSLAGGAAGVLLAYGIASGLVTMMANGGPAIALETHPDGRILGFALVVSIGSCVLFSFAPAWQATRQTLQPTLAEIRSGRWRLGKGLVVWQMAISVLLLIGAGLFGRTLLNIYSEPAGFRAENIVLFSTNAPRLDYSIEQMAGLPAPIVAGLQSLPGVRSASVSGTPPVSGGSGWDSGFEVQGYTHSPTENNVSHANSVGPDFFRTYGTPVLLGREFDARDTEQAPKVAIVNEAFVRHYFKDSAALGKWVSFARFRRADRFTIVGIVKDVKYEGLRQDAPRTVYFSIGQIPAGRHTFALRTDTNLATLTPLIGTAIERVNKELRPERVRTMQEHVAQSLLPERILATLAGAFGILALVLAAIGIYGMMAFQVARRRREIGIRMALGADARSMVGMILGETTRLTLLGCGIGAVGGLMLTRAAEGILHDVRPNDPLTFGVATIGLLLTALGAAYFPGHSAARTNPAETLRAD